jgi:hypothetical protein
MDKLCINRYRRTSRLVRHYEATRQPCQPRSCGVYGVQILADAFPKPLEMPDASYLTRDAYELQNDLRNTVQSLASKQPILKGDRSWLSAIT